MSACQPTPSDARKYADYRVVRRERTKPRPVTIGDAGGRPIRLLVEFTRVPSVQESRWYPRDGLTAQELALVERWALRLPAGGWADYPHTWFRHRMTNGRWFWLQSAGLLLEDSLDVFAEWEREMTDHLEHPLVA